MAYAQEVRRLAGTLVGRVGPVLCVGRSPGAGVVTPDRVFDLDHLCAQRASAMVICAWGGRKIPTQGRPGSECSKAATGIYLSAPNSLLAQHPVPVVGLTPARTLVMSSTRYPSSGSEPEAEETAETEKRRRPAAAKPAVRPTVRPTNCDPSSRRGRLSVRLMAGLAGSFASARYGRATWIASWDKKTRAERCAVLRRPTPSCPDVSNSQLAACRSQIAGCRDSNEDPHTQP